MKLAHRNIPAVVGMQYRIKNEVASKFTRAFYKSLADRQSVDIAVQHGRAVIADDLPNALAFGLPVLYASAWDPLFPPQTQNDIPPQQGAVRSIRDVSGVASASRAAKASGPVPGPPLLEICPWPGCNKTYAPPRDICGRCGGRLICANCGRLLTPDDENVCDCGAKIQSAVRVEGGELESVRVTPALGGGARVDSAHHAATRFDMWST
jgi:hypothetical protein